AQRLGAATAAAADGDRGELRRAGGIGEVEDDVLVGVGLAALRGRRRGRDEQPGAVLAHQDVARPGALGQGADDRLVAVAALVLDGHVVHDRVLLAVDDHEVADLAGGAGARLVALARRALERVHVAAVLAGLGVAGAGARGRQQLERRRGLLLGDRGDHAPAGEVVIAAPGRPRGGAAVRRGLGRRVTGPALGAHAGRLAGERA